MCRLQTTHGEGPLVTKPSPEPTPTKASVNSDPRKAPGHPEEVLKQLDSILGNIGIGTGEMEKDLWANDGSGGPLDPSVYLGKCDGKHALRIVDFITYSAQPEADDVQLGENLTLKVKLAKPKIENIAPSQWIAANARIGAQLLLTKDLDQESIMDYLAYTAKVEDLANRYSYLLCFTTMSIEACKLHTTLNAAK